MFAKKIASRLAALAATRRGKVVISICAAATMLCLLTSFVVLQLNFVTVVEDGKQVAAFTTIQSDMAQLLETADIVLGAEDKSQLQVDGQNITLHIKRAFPVTVKADEHIITVMVTRGTTVGGVLQLAGVSYDQQDRLSVPAHQEVSSGSEITLTRLSSKTVTKTETIDFEIETRNSSDLYKGQTKTLQQGKEGEKELTYTVKYENGEEVSRTLSSTKVIKEAVNEIKLVGTKKRPVRTSADYGKKMSAEELAGAKCITVTATAYCNTSDGGQKTATGVSTGYGIVAVDPKVIPLGTKLYITSADGSYVYGYCVAGDTGGAIKGNRVDLFLGSESECRAFGRRSMKVYILD